MQLRESSCITKIVDLLAKRLDFTALLEGLHLNITHFGAHVEEIVLQGEV